jgi:hypothetical protein
MSTAAKSPCSELKRMKRGEVKRRRIDNDFAASELFQKGDSGGNGLHRAEMTEPAKIFLPLRRLQT